MEAIIIKKNLVLSLAISILLLTSQIAFAESTPIDPLVVSNEQEKSNHSLSITYKPDFTELNIVDANGARPYLHRVDTVSCSLYSKYSMSENLSLTNTLIYNAMYSNEYLDDLRLSKEKDKLFGATLGMRCEWFGNINPSVEIYLGYPKHLGIGTALNVIRDPMIHTIGLDYSTGNDTKQLLLTQGLGFVANDKISLRAAISSIFSAASKPQINTISFLVNYSLDPKNKTSIALNNTLKSKNGILHLNFGITYNF